MAKVMEKSHFIDSEMQGIRSLEELIEKLEKELVYLQKCLQSNHTVWLIKVAKLKKERLKAFAAMSKTKVLIAELEVFLAEHENELNKHIDINNLDQSQHENKYSKSPGYRHHRYAPYRRCLTPSSHSPSSSSNVSSDSSSTVTTYNLSPTQYTEDNRLEHLPLRTNLSQTNDSFLMNKSSSTFSQSPVKTPSPQTMKKSSSSANKSDSNKSITDSIIGEFNKPYWHTNSSSTTDNIVHSSIPKLKMSVPTEPRKQAQNIKINLVSNIEAYKKASDILSLNSHVMYTPNPSNIRPSLHPRDPRAYFSKLSLEPKEQGVSRPPLSLPVPSIMKNNNVYTPPKKRLLEKSMQASYISTPKQTKKNEVTIQPLMQNVKPLQAILNYGLTNMANSTPMKHSNHRQLPATTPVKHPEHRQLPDTTPVKHSEYKQDIVISTSLSLLNSYNKNDQKPVTPIGEPEKQNILASNTINIRPMPVSTTQKWSENKHICVPIPPMYNCSTSQNLLSGSKGDIHPENLKNNSNMKENYPPNAPKQVRFYHSS